MMLATSIITNVQCSVTTATKTTVMTTKAISNGESLFLEMGGSAAFIIDSHNYEGRYKRFSAFTNPLKTTLFS